MNTSELQIARKMRAAFNITKQRCYNPSCRDYKYYGGRGITICERWLADFQNFLDDMGLRPDGMTLERKDVNGPYSPENCVWATRKEQTENRRDTLTLTVDGVTKTLNEWSAETGISYGTLKARKQRLGYSDSECLAKSVKPGEKLATKEYKPRKKPDMSRVKRGFESKAMKFTKEQVEAIIHAWKTDPFENFSSLAKKYNCSISTISNMCQSKGPYAKINNPD